MQTPTVVVGVVRLLLGSRSQLLCRIRVLVLRTLRLCRRRRGPPDFAQGHPRNGATDLVAVLALCEGQVERPLLEMRLERIRAHGLRVLPVHDHQHNTHWHVLACGPEAGLYALHNRPLWWHFGELHPELQVLFARGEVQTPTVVVGVVRLLLGSRFQLLCRIRVLVLRTLRLCRRRRGPPDFTQGHARNRATDLVALLPLCEGQVERPLLEMRL